MLLIGFIYAIPIVCSLMGLVGLTAILCLVVCHCRHQHRAHSRRHSYSHQGARRSKSNNDCDDDFPRYRNSLFDTDKGGGTSSSSPTEMKQSATELLEISEIDIEKYEKSPRHLDSRAETKNYSDQNRSPPKTVNKDINVQLSQTRTDGNT